MLKNLFKKMVPLALSGLLLVSSSLVPFGSDFAATTPAKPNKPVTPTFMSSQGIPNTATGALTVLETLLSEDSKRLRDNHNRQNPTVPFIRNVRISSDPGAGKFSIGSFTGGLAKSRTTGETILNFDKGVVFTTGSLDAVNRAYNNESRHTYSQDNGVSRNDADLAALITQPASTMMDTTFIEFEVYAPKKSDNIMFEYALASDEYNEFLTYNDVFGIFVNGKNISTIPNSNNAISISNINHLTNKQFFRNNKKDSTLRGDNYGTDDKYLDLPSEYDGFTCTFTASGGLKSEQYNRVKIAIADNKDQKLDSALFLKAGTLQFRAPEYGTINLDSWSDDNQVTMLRTEGVDNSVSVDLRVKDINGKLIQLKNEKGQLNDFLTVTFNNGEASKTITLPTISDDAIINGSLPVYVNISNPQNGAVLGPKTEITKGYVAATTQFGQWIDTDLKTDDQVEVTRTGDSRFKATVKVKITNKNNAVTNQTVTFLKGQTKVLVTVPEKTRLVELHEPSGITLGTPNTLTKTFLGTTQFGQWINTDPKTDDTIEVLRVEDTDLVATVNVKITSKDNSVTNKTVTFAKGQDKATVTVPEKTRLVELTNPNNVYLGTPNTLTKTFLGTAQFGQWINTDPKTDDTIEVLRVEDTDLVATVNVKITNKDNSVTNKTVTFAKSQDKATVTVPEKTRLVELTNPNNVYLGTPNSLTKTFLGTTQFGQWINTDPKTDDTIEVLRVEDTDLVATVNVKITSKDNSVTNKTVTFAKGQDKATVTVPEKTRLVELTNPNNVYLGTPNSLTKTFLGTAQFGQWINTDPKTDDTIEVLRVEDTDLVATLNVKITNKDNSVTNKTVTFAKGQDKATVTVPEKTRLVELTNPNNVYLGTPNSLTKTFLGTAQFGQWINTDPKTDDTIEVLRVEDTDLVATVNVKITNKDNSVTNKTVTFAKGQDKATVTVPEKTRLVELTNPNNVYLGTPNSLTKTFLGTAQFGQWINTDPKTDDTIEVLRVEDTDLVATVNVKITNKDNSVTNKTVTFAKGQDKATVTVPEKTRLVELTNPNNVYLGTPNSLTKTFLGTAQFGQWINTDPKTDDTIEVLRVEDTDLVATVNVKITNKDNSVTNKTVTFAKGQDKATVTVPEKTRLVELTSPNNVYLGTPNNLTKTFLGTVHFGNWINTDPKTDDTIEVVRIEELDITASVKVKITSKDNAVKHETVTFAKDQDKATITVPENTQFVELYEPTNINIGTPNKLEKFFSGVPTTRKKLQFDVIKNSEVSIELLAVNVASPKFNYKVTKLGSNISFYGDGKNLPNGMRDLYYMEPGTYEVEIYWLDKTQAETELLAGTSKTSFKATVTELGTNLDKKKFYKKIN